jgi:hypothetical protein
MPFVVKSDIHSESQAFRRLATERARDRRALTNQLGYYLLAKQNDHFQQLVKTGSSNGVAWPRLAESTLAKRRALQRRGLLAIADPEQIGIMTGWLASHFRFRSTANRVTITNTASYAGAFAARRPIFPATFPTQWLSGC